MNVTNFSVRMQQKVIRDAVITVQHKNTISVKSSEVYSHPYFLLFYPVEKIKIVSSIFYFIHYQKYKKASISLNLIGYHS